MNEISWANLQMLIAGIPDPYEGKKTTPKDNQDEEENTIPKPPGVTQETLEDLGF